MEYNKGQCTWTRHKKARVWVNKDGAACFEYWATNTSGAPLCSFTLFSEVGEPYKPLFDSFFAKWKVVGTVDYGKERPYIADKVERVVA